MLLDDFSVLGLRTSQFVGAVTTTETVGTPALGAVTTLNSFTVPAGVFGTNGDYIEFEYWGITAEADGCEVFLFLGSDAGFDSAAFHPDNLGWHLTGKAIRSSSSQVTFYSTFQSVLSSGAAYNKTSTVTVSSLDLLIPNVLALNGAGTTINDVRLQGSCLKFYQILS